MSGAVVIRHNNLGGEWRGAGFHAWLAYRLIRSRVGVFRTMSLLAVESNRAIFNPSKNPSDHPQCIAIAATPDAAAHRLRRRKPKTIPEPMQKSSQATVGSSKS